MVEVLYLQTVLAVMPEDDPLWRELTRCKRQLDCRRITGEDVLGGDFRIRRTQLALVAGTLEHMDKHVGGQVLARLRDLYCAVLYVLVPMGDRWSGLVSRWENQELITYGLRPARQYPATGKPLYLYHYDIFDYKLTPDWLNSKYWANPHRWDKERW
jgi:hypothetical protein